MTGGADVSLLLPGQATLGESRQATLGVLGGGQLGRMFVHAAQSLGYRCVVLDPDAASPAGAVAEQQLRADYLDTAALAQLAGACDAITTEFENVPALALQTLARDARGRPGRGGRGGLPGPCGGEGAFRGDRPDVGRATGAACAHQARG